jgi:hypothetical protein
MKLSPKILALCIPAFVMGFTCCTEKTKTMEGIYENIPALGEVSGVWVSPDSVDAEPSLRNFRGQALVNRDITSVSWIAAAPYSGGYHTGALKINGKIPMAKEWRWQPWQALRKGTLDELSVLSSTRMLVDRDAILWQVDITNNGTNGQELNLDLDLIGFICKYGGDWQWWYPYPKISGMTTTRDDEVENVRKNIGRPAQTEEMVVYELIDGKPQQKLMASPWPSDEEILACTQFTTTADGNTFIIEDNESEAITSFHLLFDPVSVEVKNAGATISWNAKVKPGEVLTIKYLIGWGDNRDILEENMHAWGGDFDRVFASIREEWESRWMQIFTPGNDIISGCFPVLETDDKLAKKVYYTGPLTMLNLIHTNLPQHEKVFLTGGPRWGASITFFWDITEWSTLWAVVDPQMMREHLASWIVIDPSKYYGQDNFGGKGVGNGYSANYWALFQMIRSYVTVSGDYDFLETEVAGKTVLEHLKRYALNWKEISIYGQEGCTDDIYRLADFGDDEWNLLECVPTYKHIVPSFNAGYIWMMRETAALLEKAGDKEEALQLRGEADEMFKRLLKLYAGEGVWYSLYPGNKKIEVRHCLDFTFLGRYLADNIPRDIREEMMDFLYRELLTDHWMRAQSLLDVAAEYSDRADHGPYGAFDGWPAATMDALVQMGFPGKALDFYHAIEPVTYEGAWSQAHELWGENKGNNKARVKIAERGWPNRDSSSGIAMSQVMLKCFFGFYPDISGEPLQPNPDWEFNGKLYHVLYHGEYYTIEYQDGKPTLKRES